jgi:hypothetical protein
VALYPVAPLGVTSLFGFTLLLLLQRAQSADLFIGVDRPFRLSFVSLRGLFRKHAFRKTQRFII